MNRYLVDANVFIQAKNTHYGLDFCPGFWRWMLVTHESGQLFSIDKVREELLAGSDELSEWVRDQASGLFLKTDAQAASHFATVAQWASNQSYEPAAINTFLQVADFYLIAHALAHDYIVVTHERPANSRRRIKIPDVCSGLGIGFMTPFEMLRRERARFVLDAA